MHFHHLIQPLVERAQLLQPAIKIDQIGHIHPRRGHCIGVRQGQQRHPTTAFFSIALTHKINHDRAQHLADVGEELQARLPAQSFALSHAHKAFVNQCGRVEPSHAAELRQSHPRQPFKVGVHAGEQRPHRIGIALASALDEDGGRGLLGRDCAVGYGGCGLQKNLSCPHCAWVLHASRQELQLFYKSLFRSGHNL